eukprot:scaffold131316_cov69-Phaeocystis_antarctica.AAC.3
MRTLSLEPAAATAYGPSTGPVGQFTVAFFTPLSTVATGLSSHTIKATLSAICLGGGRVIGGQRELRLVRGLNGLALCRPPEQLLALTSDELALFAMLSSQGLDVTAEFRAAQR